MSINTMTNTHKNNYANLYNNPKLQNKKEQLDNNTVFPHKTSPINNHTLISHIVKKDEGNRNSSTMESNVQIKVASNNFIKKKRPTLDTEKINLAYDNTNCMNSNSSVSTAEPNSRPKNSEFKFKFNPDTFERLAIKETNMKLNMKLKGNNHSNEADSIGEVYETGYAYDACFGDTSNNCNQINSNININDYQGKNINSNNNMNNIRNNLNNGIKNHLNLFNGTGSNMMNTINSNNINNPVNSRHYTSKSVITNNYINENININNNINKNINNNGNLNILKIPKQTKTILTNTHKENCLNINNNSTKLTIKERLQANKILNNTNTTVDSNNMSHKNNINTKEESDMKKAFNTIDVTETINQISNINFQKHNRNNNSNNELYSNINKKSENYVSKASIKSARIKQSFNFNNQQEETLEKDSRMLRNAYTKKASEKDINKNNENDNSKTNEETKIKAYIKKSIGSINNNITNNLTDKDYENDLCITKRNSSTRFQALKKNKNLSLNIEDNNLLEEGYSNAYSNNANEDNASFDNASSRSNYHSKHPSKELVDSQTYNNIITQSTNLPTNSSNNINFQSLRQLESLYLNNKNNIYPYETVNTNSSNTSLNNANNINSINNLNNLNINKSLRRNYLHSNTQQSLEVINEQDTPHTQTPNNCTNTYASLSTLKRLNTVSETDLSTRFNLIINSREKEINDSQSRLKNFSSKKKPLSLSLKNANKTLSLQIPFEYINDIHNNLKIEEKENQVDVYVKNPKARAVLVNWLLDVSDKFKLSDETYFLTVNILDRFMSIEKNQNLDLEYYQLIAAACLSIACKYEEIYSPEIKDFVYITDSTYSKEDILQAEIFVLTDLNFSVTYPSALRFFEVFLMFCGFSEESFGCLLKRDHESKDSNDDDDVCVRKEEYKNKNRNNKDNDDNDSTSMSFAKFKTIGDYLLQLFSLDSRSNLYYPSVIAMTVISICYRLKLNISLLPNKDNNYNKEVILPYEILRIVEKEDLELINNCYITILFNLKLSQNMKLNTVQKKFSKKKYFAIAKTNFLGIN